MRARSLQLCLTLCSPMHCSPPGSSVHGILQARILEWVAMPSSERSSQPRDWTCISYVYPALAGGFFIINATWEALMVPGAILKHINGKYLEEFRREKWSEWCWELGGAYTHRCPWIIWLWERVRVDTICIELKVGSCGLGILEWVAMPSSRTSSQPRDQTRVSCGSCIASGFFTGVLPGKPITTILCCTVLCLVTQSCLIFWDPMDVTRQAPLSMASL